MYKNTINTLRRRAVAVTAMTAAALLALTTACSDDNDPGTPSDFDTASPYTITMRVLDENSQNLLDKKTQDNILKDSVTVLFADSVYQLDTIPSSKKLPESMPKTDNADFYGLWVYAPVGTRNYLMQFGEFDGKQNLTNQRFIIRWNDGTPNDTVGWTHVYSKDGGNTTYRTDVTLNGKPATMPITFVK